MPEEAYKPRLARGLAALIGDVSEDVSVERARGQRRVPAGTLRPNPRNPRREFHEEELARLQASIRERGIVQPIVVRTLPDLPDGYEIVAGERRWRAAQAAGLHDVPVVIVEIDDQTSLEYAILENVQRADLNPIEEGTGYQRLMDEFSYSQSDLARVLGKGRSHVANTLRLLHLPEPVKQLLIGRRISPGHARALLAVRNPEQVATRILDEGLTVRDVEEIAYVEHGNMAPKDATAAARPGRPRRSPAEKDPDTRALEQALEDVLGFVVAIEHKGKGGHLRIRYGDLDQLDALCRRLRASAPR